MNVVAHPISGKGNTIDVARLVSRVSSWYVFKEGKLTKSSLVFLDGLHKKRFYQWSYLNAKPVTLFDLRV